MFDIFNNFFRYLFKSAEICKYIFAKKKYVASYSLLRANLRAIYFCLANDYLVLDDHWRTPISKLS